VAEADARGRILQAAIELLGERSEEAITVRDLAARAGVAVGAVNYYFRSKENLLHEAVVSAMRDVAEGWLERTSAPEPDPIERLQRLIKETGRVAADHPALARISIRHDLLAGSLETPRLLLPLLGEIFGRRADELTLRLVAFALIAATQVAFLRADVFGAYTGLDVFDDAQRDDCIDRLVEQLVRGARTRRRA
jgi:AcrR family transcriptional regulator